MKQKLKMIEQVMRPAIRYSMAVAPFTWAQLQDLHGVIMGAARKSCKLPGLKAVFILSTLLLRLKHQQGGLVLVLVILISNEIT